MIVLDASAVLAFLHGESGADAVEGHIGSAMMSAVNVTEIVAKLIDRAWGERQAVKSFEALGVHVIAYDQALALRAGTLRAQTRAVGLSLGDRACLALAERERLPVLTADRVWAGLDLAVDIRVIR